MWSYIIALIIAFWNPIVTSLLHHYKINHIKPKFTSNQINKKINTALSLIEDASLAEGFSNAFVGGTVGVMSVMFMLEVKQLQDETLEGCPYCMGNGEILCALCFGKGSLNQNESCSCCSGRGLVTCINCKGDGRETPIILQSKAARDPEYATDSIGIDSP